MKIKIIGISIVMLLLVLAPSTSIATEKQMHDPEYVFLLGTIVINKVENYSIYGFAIRLRFFQLLEDERTIGVITLQNVVVNQNYSRRPIIGNLHFIWGIGTGEIIW